MKTFAIILTVSALSFGNLSAQKTFDYEANKQMLIERMLMQYFSILHGDRFDVAHLDGFCDDSGKGADLTALRDVARLVPEDFTWTNRDSDVIARTPFKPGSIYTVELATTDGRTVMTQFIVSGTAEQPYLLIHDHLQLKG